MPPDVTSDLVKSCLSAAEKDLEAGIQRAKEGGNFIVYNYGLGKQDRQCMWEFRALLHELLMVNPSGIFKKSILMKGFEDWQEIHNSFPTKNKPSQYIRDQVYNVPQMLLNVKDTNRSLKTGQRAPTWLCDLCKLLSSDAHGGEDDEENEGMDMLGNMEKQNMKMDHQPPPLMHLKSQHLEAHPPSKRTRCILRRVSSAASEASAASVAPTISYDAAVVPYQTLEGPGPWMDESMGPGGKAVRLLDGDAVPASNCVADGSGFVRFEWADGFSWLSEVPVLGYPGLTKMTGVMKKPGAMKEVAKSIHEKKLLYSRGYHQAVTKFKKDCKMKEVQFDPEACKAYARVEASAAVQDFSG